MGRQLVTFGNNTYTYNEDGIRTSKTVGNALTTFYLDSANIIEQITGNTVLHFYYDSYNEIIGFEYGDNNYYYVKNAMSDIVGITDSDGNLITSYQYDPWGKVLSVTGSNTEIGNLNPFRYRSYYYDVETGFYYLQSRYYDPEVGRFINCDDVNYIGVSGTQIGYNPFAYCENDPVDCRDPNGFKSIGSNMKEIRDTIIVNILMNHLKKNIKIKERDTLLRRIKNAKYITVSSQVKKGYSILKYTVRVEYHNDAGKYFDYYYFYRGSWNDWDKYIYDYEKSIEYRVYTSNDLLIVKSMILSIVGLKYNAIGFLLSTADTFISNSISKNVSFAKASRAILNTYKKFKYTDVEFIALTRIIGDVFLKKWS